MARKQPPAPDDDAAARRRASMEEAAPMERPVANWFEAAAAVGRSSSCAAKRDAALAIVAEQGVDR